MIKNYVHGKTAVFIDAANILYSQKDLGWKIDYQKLKNYLEKQIDLAGLYFYTGFVGNYKKQLKFLRKLRKIGYKVRTKKVKFIKLNNGKHVLKGNLDVEMALDTIDDIDDYQTAILLTGDSDFACVIDRVKKAGKRVIVMSTKGHIAIDLIKRAKYINLKKLKRYIRYKE